MRSVARSLRLFATPMDGSLPGSSVHGLFQASNWGALPFPTPGDPLDPGIEPPAPASPALAGGFFATAPPGKLLRELLRGRTTRCGSHLVGPPQGSRPLPGASGFLPGHTQ